MIYKYIAKDATGKTITGTVEAQKSTDVVDALRKENLTIISITERKAKTQILKTTSGRVGLTHIVVFTRQLAALIDAGMPLVGSLDILADQMEHRRFKLIISTVKEDLESGKSLSQALAKHPQAFSKLYIAMVKAGEASGMLDDILERLSIYLEKMNALRVKLLMSMIYPATVAVIAFSITTALIVGVIPLFKGVFQTLGGELPVPTKILIMVSDLARHYFLFGLIFLIVFVVILRRFMATEGGRFFFDKAYLKVPVLGRLFLKISIAKFARTLATLAKSGVPILASLEIVATTAGNKLIERVIKNAQSSIKEGESIAEPLSRGRAFPLMVVRMISVGEKTGKLEEMLNKVAEFYEGEVDAAIPALVNLVEISIIVFLGVVIGGIVIAMFLPIFKLTQVIGM